MSSLKDLKKHILLAHPKQHICLFCVEAKGWSDEFPSQSSYNEHYNITHPELIQKKETKRSLLKQKQQGTYSPKLKHHIT